MVLVLVGDDDRVEIVRLEAETIQTRLDLGRVRTRSRGRTRVEPASMRRALPLLPLPSDAKRITGGEG
jgi:hypothetical protein